MPRSRHTQKGQTRRAVAPHIASRGPVYKDETGHVLYGFSQENLERTNKEVRKTTLYLQLLTLLVLVILGVFIASLIWADLNNVITAMIYR